MSISVIQPDAIKNGEVQNVVADLTKFDVAQQQVNLAVAELNKFKTINTVEQSNEAQDVLKIAVSVDKAIEAKRKDLGQTFANAKKQIDDYAKKLVANLTPAIESVKGGLVNFQREELRKAKEAQKAAREMQIIPLGFVYDPNSNQYKLDGIGIVTNYEIESLPDLNWKNLVDSKIRVIEERNRLLAEKLAEEKEVMESFGSEEDVEVLEKRIAEVSRPVVAIPVATTTSATNVKGLTKRWTFDVTTETLIPREYLMVNETAIRTAITAGVRDIPGVSIYQKESITVR